MGIYYIYINIYIQYISGGPVCILISRLRKMMGGGGGGGGRGEEGWWANQEVNSSRTTESLWKWRLPNLVVLQRRNVTWQNVRRLQNDFRQIVLDKTFSDRNVLTSNGQSVQWKNHLVEAEHTINIQNILRKQDLTDKHPMGKTSKVKNSTWTSYEWIKIVSRHFSFSRR